MKVNMTRENVENKKSERERDFMRESREKMKWEDIQEGKRERVGEGSERLKTLLKTLYNHFSKYRELSVALCVGGRILHTQQQQIMPCFR